MLLPTNMHTAHAAATFSVASDAPVWYNDEEETTDEKTMLAPVDIIFIIDCTDNLGDHFDRIKNDIITAAKGINVLSESARFAVIEFRYDEEPNVKSWFTDINKFEEYVLNIERTDIENSIYGTSLDICAEMDYREEASRFVFLAFDELSSWSEPLDYKRIAETQDIYNGLKINFSTLSRSSLGPSKMLVDTTDGQTISTDVSCSTAIVSHVFNNTDKVVAEESYYYAVNCSSCFNLSLFNT